MQLTSDKLTTVFDDIYKANVWTNKSGPGSGAKVNQPFIDFLSHFIAANRVTSICDFGCGDWQYMRHVNLNGAQYFGFDVAETILATTAESFTYKRVTFAKTPDDLSNLPEVDLFLSKDTFMHLPNEYVKYVIDSVRKKCRYMILVSNDHGPGLANGDIEPGQCRYLDLRSPPFSLKTIELFQYSRERILDPMYPVVLAAVLRKFVWPGRKSVHLVLGDRA